MVPVYRRFYQSGPRALAATGRAILVYDVPADAQLSAWDAALISQVVIGVTLPANFR